MKNTFKKLFLLGSGMAILSSSVMAAELGPTTPQWANLAYYLRLDGSGSIPHMAQLQEAANTYAVVKNANGTGMTYTAGKVGTAAQFDGVDDYIVMATEPTKTTYTVMFWAKRAIGTGISTIFQRGDASQCMYNPIISINNATSVVSISESGCGGTGAVGSATVPVNEFFHVAVTRSATAMRFYVNGALISTLAKSNFPSSSEVKTILGGQYAYEAAKGGYVKSFFKGVIDDAAVFKTQLNDSEVKAIYQNQNPTIPRYNFGTFERPFKADSLWNSKPIDPVLGNVAIPNIYSWFPGVKNGVWSVPVYKSVASDPAMTVVAKNDDMLLLNQTITIPHWPANVVPAAEDDGHCDIYDSTTGIVHSFFQLRKNATTGKWTAGAYAHTRIDGTGFGNAAQYKAGSRASGVTAMAGVIRKHEVDDGADQYNHALAMSLDGDSMIKSTTGKQIFEFPVTADDGHALTTNTMVNGFASTGSLIMLPKNFNLDLIKSPRIRKVAKTLMNYGAYVIDQNSDTPFVIYVENNFTYSNNPTNITPDPSNDDLRKIQYALRRVVSNSGFVDGNGNNFVPLKKQNVLSMRGEWVLAPAGANSITYGSGFNTYKQAFVFGANTKGMTFNNWYDNKVKSQDTCSWMCLKPGKTYRFKVRATNGAKLQFKIMNNAKTAYIFDSGLKSDGQFVDFTMPAENKVLFMAVKNGTVGASEVAGDLSEL